MNPLSAGGAVEHELAELPFELRFHAQKLQPKHLGVQSDGMGVTEPDIERLTNEPVRSLSLLRHGPQCALEGTAFTTHRSALYESGTTVSRR